MSGAVVHVLLGSAVAYWPVEGVWLIVIFFVLLGVVTVVVNVRGGRAAVTEQTLDAPALPAPADAPLAAPPADPMTAGEQEPHDI